MNKAKKSDAATLASEQRGAALEEYEKGMRLFQQKDLQKASARFQALLDQYPQQLGLCDRARAYLRICTQAGDARKPVRQTRNAAESFEVGVFLLNDGDFKEAVRHLERAAEHSPDDASVHVALASARIGAGDTDGCLAALRRAFEIDPSRRHYVSNVSDFDAIEDHPDFLDLVMGPDF